MGKPVVGRKKWLTGDREPPGRFLEIETRQGVHIGWVVAYYHKHDPQETEIGINIPEDNYWRQGLGTEALYLRVDHLLRELRFASLGFSTWDNNRAVLAIGRKLGFAEECRIRNDCQLTGIFYDRVKMVILRKEWEEIKALK